MALHHLLKSENSKVFILIGFIKDWWEAKDEATLITRPRRFGKTLNIAMIMTVITKENKSLFNCKLKGKD